MKINSTVFIVIAVSLVAIVSYYIGVSNQSVNPDQQSPLSNTLPIVPKQAKAVEAKPEPCIPNNRVTTTLPSLPKEEVFNIPTKQTANQPIYDKRNWPSGATGYVYAEDKGHTWIYTTPNQEQSVTSKQNPIQIVTDQLKETQQYIRSQQQKDLDTFRTTRFNNRDEAINFLNQINSKYQGLLDQAKFKSSQQIDQLKRIQSLIDAGQIDPAAGNEAMWRMVLPLYTGPILNYAAEASAATEEVKRELIATRQQQEELARQQQQEELARQQQRQRQEMMNRLNELARQQQGQRQEMMNGLDDIKRQQQWDDMERDDWQLRYNYFDNKWQYAPQNSHLQYNYMDNSWQYVPSR